MGKKDKKAKGKYDDDWENELGEDLTAGAPVNDPPEPAANGKEKTEMDSLEDDFGGLMSTIKKGKKKKKGGAAPAATPEPEDQDDAGADENLSETADANGDRQDSPAPVQTPQDDEDDEQDTANYRVKSKKEKEREKKEREKAKKKAQQSKKASAAVGPADGADGATATQANKDAGAAGKAKKPNAKVAALQKMVERQREAEEQKRREEEEEQKRIEEEERREAEEERMKEEARLRKKEKERVKKEELKAQGKYLTKKQKEQQAASELRKQQMMAGSNIQVAGLADSEETKRKKPVYGNKKKKPVARDSSDDIVHETTPITSESKDGEAVAQPVDSGKPETESDVQVQNADEPMDSWKADEANKDDLEESWEDALKEDEDEKKHEQPEPSLPEKPKIAGDQEPVKGSGKAKDHVAAPVKASTDNKVRSPQETQPTKPPPKSSQESAKAATKNQDLRSPICCIMGHVDTGKTKLLDNIRKTNVQEGEAGGITQQIGATYFPMDNIERRIEVVNKDKDIDFKIPGLLVIDTPGHESFTNLRSRGSSLCNIAILVVDIMHGLEPQTLESIRLLRDRKTPFIVALNKVDRLYGWNATKDGGFQESLAKQKKSVQREFADRLEKAKLAFAEQGLNAELFCNNKDAARYVSLVPTSAHTGEGVPDMLKLLINLTQKRMSNKLMYLSELQCTVLEVKVIEGLGTTIDVVLSNGVIHEGDKIVLCGLNGPIVTTIRALLTPQPMKEMRIKSPFVHHKEIKAAMGVKISANDLDKAVAGSRLLVCGPNDDEEELMDDVMEDLQDLMGSIDRSGVGVCVQASTLGSLEALLQFLKQMKIPVSGINIGPVYKRDIMRAGTMLEKAREYALMLCFDVNVDRDAEALAEHLGVKIFSANIIYHLFDAFKQHQSQMLEMRRQEGQQSAVFPCVLKTIASFNKKDPIILGVDVVEGVLRVGTPICALRPAQPGADGPTIIDLGRVTSIESNHKPVEKVKKGQAGGGVAIKLEAADQILYGRQVEDKDLLYSRISRDSINMLKDPAFRSEVSKEEWQLIVQLKPRFGIR